MNKIIIVKPLTINNIINSFFYPSGSYFTFTTTPIRIYTIPTITFPQDIEIVESIFTFYLSPFVIAITSFDANMLKAPPKKNPMTAE